MKILFKDKWPLFIILLLAFFLRVVNIETNPPALYGDELTLAYDAYSILKTGYDQTGAFLPLTFTMSEGRPPVYVYFSLPLVSLFGPTALSVRFLSIASGIGIAWLIYLLLQALVSKKAALIGALLVAISPWDISLSRGGFETHFALFLSLLGIYTFLQVKIKPRYLLVSAISFGLTIFTYHSYKVVIPLFLPFLFWFMDLKQLIREKKIQKNFLLGGGMLALFFGLWVYQIVGGAEIRFQNTNILNKADLATSILEKVNTERTLDDSPLKTLIHNRPVEYLTILGENYFSHFSFDFLFLHGDRNPRHNQGLMGEMYLVEFLLILLGIIFLWQKYRRTLLLFLSWIAIAPLATMLVSPAHALRSTFLLPPLIMFSAVGGVYLGELSKKELIGKAALVLIIIGLLVQFIFLLDRVYFMYPKQFGNFWSISAQVASIDAVKSSKQYDYIFLSDSIDSINLAYPVYGLIDPQLVIKQNDRTPVTLNGHKFKQFGNIYIGRLPATEVNSFLNRIPGKSLYLGPTGEETKLEDYTIINGSDNLPLLVRIAKD